MKKVLIFLTFFSIPLFAKFEWNIQRASKELSQCKKMNCEKEVQNLESAQKRFRFVWSHQSSFSRQEREEVRQAVNQAVAAYNECLSTKCGPQLKVYNRTLARYGIVIGGLGLLGLTTVGLGAGFAIGSGDKGRPVQPRGPILE